MMLDADNRNRLTTFLMLAIENEHKRANVLALQYANEEMRADLLTRERALVEQSAAHVARTSEAQKALDEARNSPQSRSMKDGPRFRVERPPESYGSPVDEDGAPTVVLPRGLSHRRDFPFIRKVIKEVLVVLGAEANEWIYTPHPSLDGYSPMDYLSGGSTARVRRLVSNTERVAEQKQAHQEAVERDIARQVGGTGEWIGQKRHDAG